MQKIKKGENVPRVADLLHALFWIVAVVVIVELLMHVEAVRTRLPMPKPYYSDNVELRRRAIEQTLVEKGRIDLLFVGSSVVRTDFRPLLFDRIHTDRTRAAVVSFNGGLSKLNHPDRTRLYLEYFYLPRFTPDIVLQGVRYAEVVNAEAADSFDRFNSGYMERAWLEGSVLGTLTNWMINNAQLLYYKGVIPTVLQRRYSLRWSVFTIDSRGYNRPGLTLVEARARKAKVVCEFKPYAEPLARQLYTAAQEYFKRAHELCRRHGIRYVLVNMPEHGDKFLFDDPATGKERYAFFLEQMREFAQTEGIPFIDITKGDPEAFRDDTLFSDYHHMSGKGAARFTMDLSTALERFAPDSDVF